jgi:hypothetical protein
MRAGQPTATANTRTDRQQVEAYDRTWGVAFQMLELTDDHRHSLTWGATPHRWTVFQRVADRLRPDAFLPHSIDATLCPHGSPVMTRPKEPFDVVPAARTS